MGINVKWEGGGRRKIFSSPDGRGRAGFGMALDGGRPMPVGDTPISAHHWSCPPPYPAPTGPMPPEGEEGRTHAVLDYVDLVLDYVDLVSDDLVLDYVELTQIHSPKPTVHPMNNEDSPILLAIFLVDFPRGTGYTGLRRLRRLRHVLF